MSSLKTVSSLLHKLLVAVVVAAACNAVILLAIGGTYDTHIGPLRLVAHGLFKPLLILTGAFLLAALFGTPRDSRPAPLSATGRKLPAALAILAALALTLSFTVNALDEEWNYSALSATRHSLADLAHLFFSSQVGLWYRPLGFTSLWLDYALFHQHLWAYHLQNIFLHFANAWLISILAKLLGRSETAARWAGALYLTAAVTFEPVIWPGARFDLLAMLFTALALIASIRFLTEADRRSPFAAIAFYALALCSKESAYAFPVFLAILLLAWPFDATLPGRSRRIALLGAGVLAVTGLMLGIRLAVLGGAGGYGSNAAAPSIHFSFTLATLRIVLARVMQMSLLTVNLTYPAPALMLLAIGAFAALMAVGVIAGASTTRRQRIFAAYALAATLPVAPMISWLDGDAQEVRYLYMAAAFVMMLAAAALSNARRPAALLFAFGLLNLCCGTYDTWIYRTTLHHSVELAHNIADDLSNQPAPAHVQILGMPNEIDGVLFSRTEVQNRLKELRPDITITFARSGVCSDSNCYLWQPQQRTLHRFGSTYINQ